MEKITNIDLDQINLLLDEEYPDAVAKTKVEFEGNTYELDIYPTEKSLSGKTVKRMGHEWKLVEKKIVVIDRLKKELKELCGNNILIFDSATLHEDLKPSLKGSDIFVQVGSIVKYEVFEK